MKGVGGAVLPFLLVCKNIPLPGGFSSEKKSLEALTQKPGELWKREGLAPCSPWLGRSRSSWPRSRSRPPSTPSPAQGCTRRHDQQAPTWKKSHQEKCFQIDQFLNLMAALRANSPSRGLPSRRWSKPRVWRLAKCLRKMEEIQNKRDYTTCQVWINRRPWVDWERVLQARLCFLPLFSGLVDENDSDEK